MSLCSLSQQKDEACDRDTWFRKEELWDLETCYIYRWKYLGKKEKIVRVS